VDQIGQFIVNHWQLCFLFLTLLLLIFLNESISQKKLATTLSPQAAVNLINHEDAKIVDTREKDLFTKGHIVDAIHLKNAESAQKSLEKYKAVPIILTCSKGIQSAALANTLKTAGFDKVFVLQGGIEAWVQAGLPLVKGK
jgi:rhodanese-related sulfurtransferase